MFFKMSRSCHKGKPRFYAMIAESYREGSKTKQRTVKSLGSVKTKQDEERARELFEKFKLGERLFVLNELKTEANLDYGIIYVCDELWKRYGLQKVMSEVAEKRRTGFDLERLTFFLTVDRLHNPSSDMDACEWMIEDAYTGNTKIKPQYLYRTLDKLVEEKVSIEQGLLKYLKKNLKLSVDVVFYDLTSTYFEGEGPKSAGYNFRPTAKRGKKQIVIGLVLADGIPITHRIWPGNTADKSTLKEAVSDLKKDFKIRKVVFVADRGVLTAANLEELDGENYDYLISTDRRKTKISKAEMIKDVTVPKGKTLGAKKVRIEKGDGKRKKDHHYILCVDTNTRKDRLKNLQDIRKNVIEKLKELKGKESKDLNAKVVKALGKNKRLFNYDTTKKLKYSLNKENWEYEKKIAGKFMIVTTTDMKPKEAMKKYKELRDIERAFRELKTSLKARPAYHYTDKRVEGHIFVCVLGLLLRRLIERNTKMSTDKVLKELRRLKVNEEFIEGNKIFRRNESSKEHKKIFKLMKISEPTKIIFD